MLTRTRRCDVFALAAFVVVVGFCSAECFGASGVPVNDLCAYEMGGRVEVRWTTPVPTASQVEYGREGHLDQRTAEDPSCLRASARPVLKQSPGYANNHRTTLPDIRAWPVYLRIVGKTEEGEPVASDTVRVDKAGPPRATLRPGRVTIHIDRGAWQDPEPPITVGVPMPKGALSDSDHLRLVHQGKPVTFQASVHSRYLDGRTVKWLRVTFIAPKGAESVTLEYGRPAVPPETDLKVELSGKAARVQTGAALLSLHDNGKDELRRGSTVIKLPRGVLVDRHGKEYVSKAERVLLEESGPVMAVLRINGHHVAKDGQEHFAFEERVYAFAGKPYVRLDYTFGNDLCRHDAPSPPYHPDSLMVAIRSLGLQFDGLGEAAVEVGAGRERCTLELGQRVFQREDFEWVQEPGNAKGRRIEGVVRAGDARIMAKNFWEQWPKSVERGQGGIHVGLLPKLPPKLYADRDKASAGRTVVGLLGDALKVGSEDQIKLYYHIRDGLHTFREGLTKTHTLYLDVSGDPMAESLIGDEPVACCDPLWIERTGVLRGLAVRVRDQFPEFDRFFATRITCYRDYRDKAREYGVMNFGDEFGERRYCWTNLEHDPQHHLFTQFARTADARFFRIASQMARHQGDVDTRHYGRVPGHVGQQWMHSVGHTSGYFPYNYMGMAEYAHHCQSGHRGHMWNRGLLEHYLLGGDRRSWNTAILVADWVAGPQTTNYDYNVARKVGWPCLITLPTYLATEDPFYLNATRLMIRKLREKSMATGDQGFYSHELEGSHCRCKVKHRGGHSGMLGIQMAGMRMYYEITGDEQVAKDIVKIARFVIGNMWIPHNGVFRSSSCPGSGPGTLVAWWISEGIGFAANYTKDPKLIDISRKAMTRALAGLPQHGGKHGRYVPRLAEGGLHEIGLLPGPSFREQRRDILAELHNPANRWLPTLVPNPDFEENIDGWLIRKGIKATRSTEVFHSGRASMRIEGGTAIQAEYVMTPHNRPGHASDINWLVPGRTYRLCVWLRVDRLDPGTQPPSVRIALREEPGVRSRILKHSKPYDTSRMRTWQRLTCDFTVPEWNRRNYIALNNHHRNFNVPPASGGLLYLDDVSIVPVSKAPADTYEYVRLDAPSAKCSGKTRTKSGTAPLGHGLAGAGTATYEFQVHQGGQFQVWAKVDAPEREVGKLTIRGATPKPIRGARLPTWADLGTITLKPGSYRAVLKITDDKAWIGRIVLTTDPGDE